MGERRWCESFGVGFEGLEDVGELETVKEYSRRVGQKEALKKDERKGETGDERKSRWRGEKREEGTLEATTRREGSDRSAG